MKGCHFANEPSGDRDDLTLTARSQYGKQDCSGERRTRWKLDPFLTTRLSMASTNQHARRAHEVDFTFSIDYQA